MRRSVVGLTIALMAAAAGADRDVPAGKPAGSRPAPLSGLKIDRPKRQVIIDMRRQYDRILCRIIERGIERGLFASGNVKLAAYGVASMITGAALRLMRITYLDAQAILFDVNATAAADLASIHDASLDDMATFAPETEIAAAIHLKAMVRMFMN